MAIVFIKGDRNILRLQPKICIYLKNKNERVQNTKDGKENTIRRLKNLKVMSPYLFSVVVAAVLEEAVREEDQKATPLTPARPRTPRRDKQTQQQVTLLIWHYIVPQLENLYESNPP